MDSSQLQSSLKDLMQAVLKFTLHLADHSEAVFDGRAKCWKFYCDSLFSIAVLCDLLDYFIGLSLDLVLRHAGDEEVERPLANVSWYLAVLTLWIGLLQHDLASNLFEF